MQVDLAALPLGVLLLAYNDLVMDRSRLSLATSVDGGESWRRVVVLEADARGSFHYPTIHYLPERYTRASWCPKPGLALGSSRMRGGMVLCRIGLW